MAELRWILSGLGVVAIGAIWWWSTRRSGQAPGNAELRESSVVPLQSRNPELDSRERAAEPRDRADARERPEVRDRTIAPLEPLSIRTADFERVPILDLPMMTGAPSAPAPAEDPPVAESSPPLSAAASDAGGNLGDADMPALRTHAAPGTHAAPAAPARESVALSAGAANGDRPAAPDPAPPYVSEQQKIVTLRVCAVGETRWSGRALMSALEGHGLAYGRYQVFHRRHADGRSVFCVASLIEPGTFDAERMAEQEHRGVSMFAVLPGPLEPLQAIDALLATARELARDLSGTVQDVKGMPFSPQRIATLREDVARFQSVLNSSTRAPSAGGPAA